MSNGELAQGAWFPLYVGDFIRGTVHLSGEEVGCYLRLLMYQWVKGSIPDDLERLTRITGCSVETVAEIAAEFFPDGINPRLADESVITLDKRQAAHDKSVKMNLARWGERDQTGDNPHSSGRGGSSKDGTEPHTEPESPESMVESTKESIEDAARNPPSIHAGILDVSSPPPPSPPSPESSPESQSQPDSKSLPSAKPRVTNTMWDAFKESYPKREGTQNWGEARQRANRLVKANTDWAEIMIGVRRYADHISDAGKVGTQHVLQAATFLSPKRMQWTEHYAPASNQNDLTRHNVATIQKFI